MAPGFAGGARDSHESAEETAVREAREEAGLPAERLAVRATVITAELAGIGGTSWTYTTVVADADELLHTVPNRESAELRWVGEDEVDGLPLHPGFAASWQQLRTAPAIVPMDHGDERRRGYRARWRSRPGSSFGACRAIQLGPITHRRC